MHRHVGALGAQRSAHQAFAAVLQTGRFRALRPGARAPVTQGLGGRRHRCQYMNRSPGYGGTGQHGGRRTGRPDTIGHKVVMYILQISTVTCWCLLNCFLTCPNQGNPALHHDTSDAGIYCWTPVERHRQEQTLRRRSIRGTARSKPAFHVWAGKSAI